MNARHWNRLAIVLGIAVLAAGGPWLVHQLRGLPADAMRGRGARRIVTLEVGGLTCDVCAASVSTRLARVPGVSTVDVRYRERRAYVVCDAGVADSSLTAAVHQAGPGFLAAVQTP